MVRAKNIGIGGNVVRSLVVFELPGALCTIDLLQIIDTRIPPIPAASPTSEFLDDRWSHGEDNRQSYEAVNDCDASCFFQSDSDIAAVVPICAALA